MSALKRVVERTLLVSGVAARSRRRRQGDALVLAYHGVAPRGAAPAGERSLHLPMDRFVAQLDALRETHDVVPLPELLAGEGGGDRPRAAVTFDDAYLGALRFALPELAMRGMPATIFVAPGILGVRATWWDALAEAHDGEVPPAMRDEALDRHAGDFAEVATRWPGQFARGADLPDWARPASERELVELASGPLVTIAAHSWSHPNLARLDEAALARELAMPRAWLEERFGNVAPILAYPYGRVSPTVERAAHAAGYRWGVRVDGGWLRRGTIELPFAVPRLNVPAALSDDGFRLRASGLLCE